MSDRVWGVCLIIIGVIIVWNGWLLGQNERATSMFDVLGPDRYIILIGALIIFSGILIALSRPANAASAGTGERSLAPTTFSIALSVYAATIPWLGYTTATFFFFVGAFLLAGRRNIISTLVISVISTASFYLLFIYFADMPLPLGIFGV